MNKQKSLNLLLQIILLLGTALTAKAQTEVNSESETELIQEIKPFSVFADGSAVLLGGFGIKATYSVQDYLALGLIGSYGHMKSSENENSSIYYRDDYKHSLGKVGIVAEFLILNEQRKGGLYITLGVNHAQVKTEVNSDLFGSNSSENSRTGGLVAFGWHYTERLTAKANVAFQLGLGYGNGGAVAWTYSGTKTEVRDRLLLDIKAGLQF